MEQIGELRKNEFSRLHAILAKDIDSAKIA